MESSSINFSNRGQRHWLSILGDLILVVSCLGLVTWIFSARDPLWLRLNPSPLILVPLLLGGRYGLGPGLVAGLVTSVIGLAVAVQQGFGAWSSVLYDFRFLFAGLPVLGIVAGELRSALMRTQIDAEKSVTHLQEENLRTVAALRVAEESTMRLERQLAVHGLEMVSLDNELATLLKAEDQVLYREVLQLLYRISGLQHAAIYLPSNGSGQMQRAATLEEGGSIPEVVAIEDPMVERALVSRDLVTCRDLWEGTPRQSGQWIAALPWVDHCGNVRALLMIRRMALRSINWHTFDRMKTVCQWVTCCRLLRAGSHALSDAEASTFRPQWDEDVQSLRSSEDENFDRLEETARLCVRSRDLHQLATVGLALSGTSDSLARTETEQILECLGQCLRSQDVCAFDPDSDRILVILPMLDLRSAGPIVERLLAVLHGGDQNSAAKCWQTQLQASESADGFLCRLRKGEG
ncbi:MAG: hypothetical protein ACI9R3_004279 [Verrucomicrobiales bacterium]|jgi:hypothetical protein